VSTQYDLVEKSSSIEKPKGGSDLYYKFAWLPFFPVILVISLLLKLKNRKLASDESYLLHQQEFFGFFYGMLERIGYTHLVRTDKFQSLRRVVAEYAFDELGGPPVRMLDVATGFGFQARALKEAGATVVYGVDIVSERVQGAIALHGDHDIRFEAMDAQAMVFRDGFFDATVVSCALHDMPSQTKIGVIDEMIRVTKIGGNIVILEPRTFQNRVTGQVLSMIGEFLDESLNIREYVMDDLNAILESRGLTIVKQENLYTGRVLNLKLCRVTAKAKVALSSQVDRGELRIS